MSKKIILSALFAAVAFFPLSTTSVYAANCADELKVVESKWNDTQEGEVRYRRGAESNIAVAKKALVANDNAKCMQQVAEAHRSLRTIKESSDGDSGDSE